MFEYVVYYIQLAF